MTIHAGKCGGGLGWCVHRGPTERRFILVAQRHYFKPGLLSGPKYIVQVLWSDGVCELVGPLEYR